MNRYREISMDPRDSAESVFACSGGWLLDQTPAPPRWLIPGLIPQAVPVVLAAKGGLGKTFIMLQNLVSMATGKPFLDGPAQEPMGAVYFGAEDSREVLIRRLHAIRRNYREKGAWTSRDEDLMESHFRAMEINWTSPGQTGYLPDLMGKVETVLGALNQEGVRPGGIILDTLARFSNGDENKVEAIRPIVSACFKICGFGYTPVVCHHVAKGQEGARTKDKPTLAERMSPEYLRGSSAIHDNFRGVTQMASILESEAESAGLDPDKARMGGYVVFGATKLNGGARQDWRFLEQDEHGLWHVHPEGAEILAKIRGSKAVAALSKQEEILRSIFHATRGGGLLDLGALALKHYPERDPKAAKNALYQVLNRLKRAGFLQESGNALTVSGLNRVQVRAGGNGNA